MAEDTDAAAADQTGQGGQQTDADSQQQADGSSQDDKDAKPDGLVPQADLDKAIGRRQAALKRAQEAEAQVAELKKVQEGMPDTETLQQFQEWQNDQNAQTRDKAMEDGDVEAIETRVREPLQKQIDAIQGKNQRLQGQLTSLLRNNALRLAAVEAGAYYPDHVVGLLQHRVKMVEQNDGSFVPEYFDADGQPLYDGDAKRVADAKGFVGIFLADPANAYLVKSNAQPGSGAKQAGGQQQTGEEKLPTTAEEFNALPPEERAEVTAKLGVEGIKKILGVGQRQIENTL